MGRTLLRTRMSLVVLLLTLLTACVSTRSLEDVPSARSLEGAGAAILRVVRDSGPPASDYETHVLSARVTRVGDRGTRRARLLRSSDASYFTATLGGVLDPGRYALSSLEMSYLGREEYHYFEGNSLTFEVLPNTVTVVGSLVLRRDGSEPFYLPAETDSPSWVEHSFPVVQKPGIQVAGAAGVATSKLPVVRASAGELKRRAWAAASWVQLETGDFAAPGRLGTVLHRRRDSSLREVIDIGSWSTSLFVQGWKGGLLVAGEEGLLRYSPDGRNAWRALKAPVPGAIHAVQPFGDGKLAALARAGDLWTVHVTDDVFAGTWRQLASFEFEQFRGARIQPVPHAVAILDKLGVMQSDGSYRFVHLHGGHVESSEPSALIRDLSATRDGAIAVRVPAMGTIQLSTDGGATWEKLDLPASSVLFSLADRQTIYAISHEAAGPLDASFVVHVSRNAGKEWSRSGTAPIQLGQATKLWAMPTNRLQVELTDGSVLESTDAGVHWIRLAR
jgi:hypothetical protein